MESKQKNADKLGLGRLLIWKSSDVAQAAVQTIVLGFLTLYCTDTLGINPAVLGGLLFASKIIDAIVDSFAGWLVDNTNTKLGKGRPYEICIIGIMICSVGLFAANPAWSDIFKYAWIFIMYTLVFSVFTAFRMAATTPYTIRAFSNNQTLITKVASYGGIITMSSAIAINIAFPIVMGKLATSASGWTAAVAIFFIPLGLIGLLRLIFIKEDPSVDVGDQHQRISVKEILTMFKVNQYIWIFAGMMLCYNIITALGVATYYFKWIIGNTSMMSVMSATAIVTLPAMMLFPIIIRKIGTMGDMVALFCAIGVVGYVISFIANDNFKLVLIGALISSFAQLPLAYYGVLFIMKCCTYNQMNGLPRMDGSAGILSNCMSKVGSAAGSVITGVLLSLSGYVSGENVIEQPASALFMIRILYAVIPAIALIIIGICAKKFAHLEKKIPGWEEIQKAEANTIKAE